MKHTLLGLTIALVLLTPQSVVASPEEVKIITYYSTPDTEYVDLDVQSSPRLATKGGNVIVGQKIEGKSLTGDGDLDVTGAMAVKSGILKPKGELMLATVNAAPDQEGEMWVE